MISKSAIALANLLASGGAVTTDKIDNAAKIIDAELSPKSNNYNFGSDSEFLMHSIECHTKIFYQQVLEPRAKSFHAKHQTGRMFRDDEIDKAVLELVTQICREFGENYIEYMLKYFGSKEHLVAYILTRVKNNILQKATAYNEAYLRTMHRVHEINKL